MVTAHSITIKKMGNISRFIYITGCDGTGKTTQARLLTEKLQSQGIQTQHIWLRFPFLLSIPLLAYARWFGYSWYETTEGFRHGYWDFRNSWLLQSFLPWFLLFDAGLAAIRKIYLPIMRGKTVICERFVLDMLVDLSIACGDPHLHLRYPGKLYLHLLPRETKIFILDLDSETIRYRRRDLTVDQRLQNRLDAYRSLAEDLSLPILSSINPPNELRNLVFQSVSE